MNILYKIFKIEPDSLTGKLLYKGVMLFVTAMVLFASISMAWLLKVSSNNLEKRGIRPQASNIGVTYQIKINEDYDFTDATNADGVINVFGIIPGGNVRILLIRIENFDEGFEAFDVEYSIYMSEAKGWLYVFDEEAEKYVYVDDSGKLVYDFIQLRIISVPDGPEDPAEYTGWSHERAVYADNVLMSGNPGERNPISLRDVFDNPASDSFGLITSVTATGSVTYLLIEIYANDLEDDNAIALLQNAKMDIPEISVKVTRTEKSPG